MSGIQFDQVLPGLQQWKVVWWRGWKEWQRDLKTFSRVFTSAWEALGQYWACHSPFLLCIPWWQACLCPLLMIAPVVGPNQQPVFFVMVFKPGLCSQLVKGWEQGFHRSFHSPPLWASLPFCCRPHLSRSGFGSVLGRRSKTICRQYVAALCSWDNVPALLNIEKKKKEKCCPGWLIGLFDYFVYRMSPAKAK